MEEQTTFEKLKKGLFQLLDGYPDYMFFGKIEYYLKSHKSSLKVLKKDGIIEFASKEESKELNKALTQKHWAELRAEGKKEPTWYRLAPKGIDLAVSLKNSDYSKAIAEYSQKVSEYNKEVLEHTRETQEFNRRIINLTTLLVFIGLLTLIIGIISILPNLISAFGSLF